MGIQHPSSQHSELEVDATRLTAYVQDSEPEQEVGLVEEVVLLQEEEEEAVAEVPLVGDVQEVAAVLHPWDDTDV